MTQKFDISKSVITFSAIILIVIRLLGDTVLFFSRALDTDTAAAWKFILFGMLYAVCTFAFFYKRVFSGKYTEKLMKDTFIRDSLRMCGLFAIMLAAIGLLPETLSAYLLENSLANLLLTDVFALAMSFLVCYLCYMFFKWTDLVKHKHTKVYNRLLIVFYAVILLSDLLDNIIPFEFFGVIRVLLYISGGILVILQFSNNSWIAVLPRNKKFKTYGACALSFVLLIILCGNATDDNSASYSAMVYFTDLNSVLTFPFICLLCAFAKIGMATLLSIPTGGIVERRTFEIESLTYLNQIVANTVEFDNLLKTICQLALSSTNAQIAWVEIFAHENSESKLYSENISPLQVQDIHKDTYAEKLLLNVSKPLLIGSVEEAIKENPQFEVFGFAGSMAIIPLYFKSEKIGNLVVISNDEYSLDDDTLTLLNAYKDNISIAIENAKLLEDSIEKEKYKQEVALAKDMQDKLLPKVVPQHISYSLAAKTQSAEIVGGDYYDIVYLKNGKMCILIGDVSGKGISASFYMAQLKGVVLSQAKEATTATDILKRINAVLYGKMDRKMYITLSALVLDDANGHVSFARGGHMPTVIKHSSEITFYQPKGFGIGLVPPSKYNSNLEEVSIQLSPGDVCFMFSDGVNELRNTAGDEFGYDNLKLFLSSDVFDSAQSVINSIETHLQEFACNAGQIDDITIVAVVFMPQSDTGKQKDNT